MSIIFKKEAMPSLASLLKERNEILMIAYHYQSGTGSLENNPRIDDLTREIVKAFAYANGEAWLIRDGGGGGDGIYKKFTASLSIATGEYRFIVPCHDAELAALINGDTTAYNVYMALVERIDILGGMSLFWSNKGKS